MGRNAYSDELIREYQNQANEDAADWCEACGGAYVALSYTEPGMEFCPHCRPKALEAIASCPACLSVAPVHTCEIYDDRHYSISLFSD